ncbi:putative indoleamine 2,3-dioxygenase [Seiridium unicorne]|uniref:Indoleamine 2,3-dioxygenase n=1 Tax=Seiridium unicorne TaxID=138068 RepID=A0ABR2VAW6_9PEZI
MLFASLLFLLPFVIASTLLLKRRRVAADEAYAETVGVSQTEGLLATKYQQRHELTSAFTSLINEDGAGTWPPKANHTNWPSALRPYREVYLEMVPYLSTATPSLSDAVNRERCISFRSSMRGLLAERVSNVKVDGIMRQMENGNLDILPRDQINGFYCVVAVCRHAYRWATIPVVKVAQAETDVTFPMELELPWFYLQKHFGITAASGNNTANVLLNFDKNGDRIYKINVGMSDLIQTSEDIFFRMFRDIEISAYPVYKDMIDSVVFFERGDKMTCLRHLENITRGIRTLLLTFYDNMVETRISHSVWLSYVQGFEGWGLERASKGVRIKDDGVSGNHVLFFQCLDAFLGLTPYLAEADYLRYIPIHQRELCTAFREHSFWSMVNNDEHKEIRDQMIKIIKHLKVANVPNLLLATRIRCLHISTHQLQPNFICIMMLRRYSFTVTRVIRLAELIRVILKFARLDSSPPNGFNIGELRIRTQFDLLALPSPTGLNLSSLLFGVDQETSDASDARFTLDLPLESPLHSWSAGLAGIDVFSRSRGLIRGLTTPIGHKPVHFQPLMIFLLLSAAHRDAQMAIHPEETTKEWVHNNATHWQSDEAMAERAIELRRPLGRLHRDLQDQ